MEEKQIQYAAMIQGKLSELFDEDNESSYKIDQKELQEDDNCTAFIHAMANMVPCMFFNKLTGDNKNTLEFNHIANHLVFQFSKKQDA